MTTPALPDPEDAAMVERILASMAMQGALAALEERFAGHMLAVMETTVGRINAVTGLGVNIPDYLQRQIIAQGGTDLLGLDIEGQTRRALFAALAESRAQGLHPSSAATRRLIQDYVTSGRFVRAGVAARAKLIARTETMLAQNESTLAAYENTATVRAVEAADDQMGHGDDECSVRDGQVYSIAEARGITDHPNGTLRWLPVV